MRSLIKILFISVLLLAGQGPGKALFGAGEPEPGIFIIDDFESPNSYENYQVNQQDQSVLNLSASPDRMKGNLSLELSYYLKSTLPTGASVALERYYTSKDLLNIKGAGRFGILVKGDGSGNVFRLTFIDSDNELWEYENKSVLHSVKWEPLFVNYSDFRLAENSPRKNGAFDLDAVRGYRITVYNQFSRTMQGVAVKSSQGIILIDYLYAQIFAEGALDKEEPPEEEEEEAAPEIKAAPGEGRVKFSGSIYNEYFSVPDKINELKHWARIDMTAHYGKMSGKVVLAAEAQSFGDSAYRKDENDRYTGQIIQNYPAAVIPFIQVRANNIADYVGNITLGNLLFEYSRYTFSPTMGYDDTWGIEKVTPDWGYKGASIEGNLRIMSYHAFFLKQALDSSTFGMRLNRHFNAFRAIEMSSLDLKFYYVNSQETARFTNDNSIRKSGRDQVASLDLAARFLDYKVGLEGFFAYNDFSRTGQVSYADPYEPVFQQALAEKINERDEGYKARLILDSLLLSGLYMTYEARHLGENFKPKYRMEPILFDDIDSDQNGHNVLASYRLWGFTLTGEFDELKRISDAKYYRHRRSGSLACSALRNLFLSYFLEWKREYYEYVSMRSYYNTARDDEITAQEFYLKAQIRYNFDLGFKLRVEDVKWPAEDKKFNSQSVYIKSNYYLANNFLIFAESRMSRFGEVSWFSPGYNPYIDNFARAGVMYNF